MVYLVSYLLILMNASLLPHLPAMCPISIKP